MYLGMISTLLFLPLGDSYCREIVWTKPLALVRWREDDSWLRLSTRRGQVWVLIGPCSSFPSLLCDLPLWGRGVWNPAGTWKQRWAAALRALPAPTVWSPPGLTASLPSHLGLAAGTGQETIFLEGATAGKGKCPCSFCGYKRLGEPTWLLGAQGLFGAAELLGWGRHGREANQPSSLGFACLTEECLFSWHLPAPPVSLGGSCLRREGQAALERQGKAEK